MGDEPSETNDLQAVGPFATTDRDGEAAAVYVRPKGYGPEVPVVRRIGDRDLFLGNALAAEPDGHDRAFDHVLSLCSESRPLTTQHFPLEDGPGNAWSTFESAVDAARELYRREGSVLIHCKLGISRSTAVVAVTIAAEENTLFHDALAAVQEDRPHAIPHPELHELAVIYLAASDRDDG